MSSIICAKVCAPCHSIIITGYTFLKWHTCFQLIIFWIHSSENRSLLSCHMYSYDTAPRFCNKMLFI
jgi:hypothetical protein